MTKRWSSTQRSIALSSAEAELYATTTPFNGAKGCKSWAETSARTFAHAPSLTLKAQSD